MTQVLHERGHKVTGLDTDYYYNCDFGSPRLSYPKIEKDIRNVGVEEIRGFDAIVHLAGLSNDPLGSIRAELTYEINHQASMRLAHMAKQAGIRRFCARTGRAGWSLSGCGTVTLRPPTWPAQPCERPGHRAAGLGEVDGQR